MGSNNNDDIFFEDLFFRNKLQYDWVPNAITYGFCYVVFDKYDKIYRGTSLT